MLFPRSISISRPDQPDLIAIKIRLVQCHAMSRFLVFVLKVALFHQVQNRAPEYPDDAPDQRPVLQRHDGELQHGHQRPDLLPRADYRPEVLHLRKETRVSVWVFLFGCFWPALTGSYVGTNGPLLFTFLDGERWRQGEIQKNENSQ